MWQSQLSDYKKRSDVCAYMLDSITVVFSNVEFFLWTWLYFGLRTLSNSSFVTLLFMMLTNIHKPCLSLLQYCAMAHTLLWPVNKFEFQTICSSLTQEVALCETLKTWHNFFSSNLQRPTLLPRNFYKRQKQKQTENSYQFLLISFIRWIYVSPLVLWLETVRGKSCWNKIVQAFNSLCRK